ncbi:MAG: immunoglobulin domain-containing protein [Verrucomicrobia bacterium]|nr:immunoglobulin domain-containing protein [Verrucomicrobiota bacterium]
MKYDVSHRKSWFEILTLCLASWLAASHHAGAASATLWQARNGSVNAPVRPVEWAKGNSGPANSHYVEGYSVPYRMVIAGLTNGPHTLVIEWDTLHKGKHAFDYITHYQRLEPHDLIGNHTAGEIVNPLGGLAETFGEPTTFPIPAPSPASGSAAGQPTASFESLPANERLMTIWNGSITGISYLSEDLVNGEVGTTRLQINFVATNENVVIAWGGHIASKLDWGSGNSAVDIWGAPYHMRKISLNGTGGNQDRSVQALAIKSPPIVALSGATTVCARGTNIFHLTTDTKDDTATFAWTIGENSAGARIVGATNETSVAIVAESAGTFSLHATVFSNGSKGTASATVIVTPATTISSLADLSACPNTAVDFSITTEGTAPFRYQWSKDGVVLADATNSSLALPSVTASDAGVYCVEVIGECGSATTCSTLTIEPPLILTGPADATVECYGDVPAPDINLVQAASSSGPATILHLGDWPQTNGGIVTIARIYEAVDSCASPVQWLQQIIVADTMAPTIVCPADLAVVEDAPASGVASVSFSTPAGSDNCDASPAVSCEPASGAAFPVGETIVLCTVIDASANTNACSFRVHVVPQRIVANSTGDSGPGTLRQAMLDANSAPGSNVIAFAFTGGAPYVIHLQSPLPPITDPLTIDGWSQIEFRGQPVIELDGTNVISAAGEAPLVEGLHLTSFNSEVRGLTLNGFDVGIVISGGGGNIIQGNFIGTDSLGATAISNRSDGIRIHSAGNLVGGETAAARNVISGNGGFGVVIDGSNAVSNVIAGNLIGIADQTLAPLGNALGGVALRNGAANNLIGTGNIIAFNGGNGVLLEATAGTGNAIRGNSIYSNGALGIDLGGDGDTPNDDDDSDTGPNEFQNAPVLAFAQIAGETTVVAGTVRGHPNATYQIDFYLGATNASGGFGGGETYLGLTTVTADTNGLATFNATLAVAVPVERLITATATDADNNTSEFSLPAQVFGAPIIVEQPIGGPINPGESFTLCVSATGSNPLTYQWRLNGANIPDATNSCFTVENAQLTDGGSYTVVVANDLGVATSEPAVLRLILPPVAVADNFADRVPLPGTNGLVAWNNNHATLEPGEPNHAGKPGGRSIWYSWTAPTTGIATFSAIGSAFDTLLAVYTGNSVSNLTLIESDEDRGGFFTSILRFNAIAGTEYQIAIDGFGGASGEFVFGWQFEPTLDLLPVIAKPPVSETVLAGDTVTFSVNAVPGCADDEKGCEEDDKDDKKKTRITYQWFFNGEPIPGATRTTLTITNVQEVNVGTYTVRITTGKQTIETQPVSLQLNESGPGLQRVQAKDKFLDAATSTPLSLGTPQSRVRAAGAPDDIAIAAAAIVRSYTSTQVFSSAGGTTSADERLLCFGVGGASEWFAVVTEEDGRLYVNTDGSSYDTVMAVYTYAPTNAGLALLGCDNNSGKDGRDSAVSIPVSAGQTNFIVIDGFNGASGVARLQCTLVTPGKLTPVGITAQKTFRLRLTGQPAMRFTLQGSTNFVNWTSLTTNTSSSGLFEFTDPRSTNGPFRFYRALMLP